MGTFDCIAFVDWLRTAADAVAVPDAVAGNLLSALIAFRSSTLPAHIWSHYFVLFVQHLPQRTKASQLSHQRTLPGGGGGGGGGQEGGQDICKLVPLQRATACSITHAGRLCNPFHCYELERSRQEYGSCCSYGVENAAAAVSFASWRSAGGSAIGAEGGAGGGGGAAGNTYTGRKLQGNKQQPPKPVKPTPQTVNVGGNGGNGGGAYNKGPVTGGNGGKGTHSQPCYQLQVALQITLNDTRCGQYYSMLGVATFF